MELGSTTDADASYFDTLRATQSATHLQFSWDLSYFFYPEENLSYSGTNVNESSAPADKKSNRYEKN